MFGRSKKEKKMPKNESLLYQDICALLENGNIFDFERPILEEAKRRFEKGNVIQNVVLYLHQQLQTPAIGGRLSDDVSKLFCELRSRKYMKNEFIKGGPFIMSGPSL